MENKRTSSILQVILAVALIAGGVLLAGYFLSELSHTYDLTKGGALLGLIGMYVPVITGCVWLGRLRNGQLNNRMGGIIFGVLLIAAGLIFLGFSLGAYTVALKPMIISWGMPLLVLAFFGYYERNYTWATMLLIGGTFLMISRIARVYPLSWPFESNFAAEYWPTLLIALGIIIVVGVIFKQANGPRRHRHSRDDKNRSGSHHTVINEAEHDGSGKIDYSLIFSSTEQVFLESVFRGGDINTVLAGTTLDLRRTTLPQGNTYLEVNTVLGGFTLFVPNEWAIEIHSNSFCGAVIDNRRYKTAPENPESKLIIEASCVFGGVEIK